MKCPRCNVELAIADRQGIEIDYCPQCRGIWLERGELDKIIERSGAEGEIQRNIRDDWDDYPRYTDHDYQRQKKRKSFIGELFDFD